MVPGVSDFVGEFTSDKAWGDEGYLIDKGLIPLPEGDRKAIRQGALTLSPLSL